ncbi:hypothetical protein FRC08_009632 [Ceratobasidium sp. 394]|nr:hypothetical protein FRC08_009632 [Ceratobasidium sp. 394]
MEPETLAYAYIIIVPNPMESETLGIRRETAADKLGEYYFWMKIGDSDNPKQRLSQYQDPDSAYVTLRLATTGGFDNPGKALELAHLMHNAKGGLKPGATTEWRALCAMDEEGAFDLRDRLISLLEEVPEKIHTYKQASKLIKTAVKNTYTAGWSVRGPGKSYSWLSIVVQPRIDIGETTAGFTTFDGNGNYGPSVFRVSLKGTVSMCNTADSLVASHYVNLCPDVSYASSFGTQSGHS